MAHSSDDPEDSHMGHSSKLLYIASFTEEEKKAIASLVLLKHKPVVYNRSESGKEDAHNADHAQVEANISSGPSQMANHNAGPSKTQVEAPSGFPVEAENYIGVFSESEVELFRKILTNECQEDISYHGASADGNSIESPNAGFSSSKGYDKRIWEQKKKYFELKDEDKCDIELSVGNRKNEVYRDMGNHSTSADNNNIENPNVRFSNWKDRGKQLFKKTMCFESKDKGRSKDELFVGIRKDKVHKDIGHDGGRDEDINIENRNVGLSRVPNIGHSHWKGSNKRMYEHKKYFELKYTDELSLGIKKDEAHKDMCHHDTGTDGRFSNWKSSNWQINEKNIDLKDKDEAYKDIGHSCANADDNLKINKENKKYFDINAKEEPEDEVLQKIRRDDVHKDIGNDDASADYNSMENPKTWVSEEGADININGKRVGSKTNRNDKCVRGRPRRRSQAIGVCDYQRSGRYEANIWLKKERRQIHLGQYFIAEAAARCSDKAMLVTRLSPERNLNYCAEDYDMKLIEEWRQVFSEDVTKFAEILREQSKKFSEGCVKGLNDEAASKLLQLIEEKKKVEADAINKSSLI